MGISGGGSWTKDGEVVAVMEDSGHLQGHELEEKERGAMNNILSAL